MRPRSRPPARRRRHRPQPADRVPRSAWEGTGARAAGKQLQRGAQADFRSAVRASPLQLSFDAKFSRRSQCGRGFFSDGSFTYRVNPGRLHLVGAPEPAAGGGRRVPDRHLPADPSGAAELKLSSLVLQPAHRPCIAHEAPRRSAPRSSSKTLQAQAALAAAGASARPRRRRIP